MNRYLYILSQMSRPKDRLQNWWMSSNCTDKLPPALMCLY